MINIIIRMKLLSKTCRPDVGIFSSTPLNISQQSEFLEKTSSFLEILRIHKAVSRCAVACMKKFGVNGGETKKKLQGHIRNLAAETDCLDKDKMEFRLVFFSYVVKLYKRKFETIIASPKLVQNKRRRNQKDKFFQIHAPPTLEQTKLNDGIDMNQFLLKVTNNSISLPDSQCICCSRVFIKGQSFFNHNHQFSKVVALSETQWDRDTLEKYTCAVCNLGGGTILVGAEGQKSSKIKGIKFKNSKQIQEKEKLVKSLTDTIHPDFQIQQKVVTVLGGKNYNAEQQKKQLFCIIISIKPSDKSRKFYTESKNKGCHSLYQTYQLDQQCQLIKYKNDQNRIQKFYDFAVQHYAKKIHHKRPFPRHKNIKCNNSDDFKQIDEINEDEALKVPDNEDELKFKYTYSSLFIVGSKKKDQHVKNLCEYLKEKKTVFEITKPFSSSFKEGVRSVWLISHSDRHQDIKRYLKEKDKSGSITMVPIYKTLQIQKDKLTAQNEAIIEKLFKAKYSISNYKVQEITQAVDGITKKIVSQVFNCFAHAIYAYMIFESLQLRPYFVKNNTTYKKKAKTTVVQ